MVRERYREISRVAGSHLTAEVGIIFTTEGEVGTIAPTQHAREASTPCKHLVVSRLRCGASCVIRRSISRSWTDTWLQEERRADADPRSNFVHLVCGLW